MSGIINSEMPISKEDQVLDYTQEMRRKIVDKFTENGVSKDIKEASIILATLDGMDRAALGVKKIKVEDKTATNNAQTTAMIAAMLNKVGARSMDNFDENRKIPELGDEVPSQEFLEGETTLGVQKGDYEQFMASMASSRPEEE